MRRTYKIIAIILGVMICILPAASCKVPGEKDDKKTLTGLTYPELDKKDDILDRTEQGDIIYVVKPGIKGISGEKGLGTAEKMLLQSLQGVVAQRKAEIYLGSAGDKYLKYIRQRYNLTVDDGTFVYKYVNGEEEKTESKNTWLTTLGGIINHYAETGDIKGYVKLRFEASKFSELKNQSNQASTIAGAYSYIMVAENTEESLNTYCPSVKLGSLSNGSKTADISKTNITQYEVFLECEDLLNKDILIMQAANRVENLREYGIAKKAGFYFYNESDPVPERDYVYRSLNVMANAYGWEQIDQNEDGVAVGMREDPSVDFASDRDVNVFAADWCSNLSIWMSMPVEEIEQKDYVTLSTEEENAHYVTFLYSDGDNIQWTAGSSFADSFFLGTKAESKAMPFGWTLTPSLAEVSPGMMSYLYENMTDKEQFVGSVSGYAYSHPARFSDEALALFARNTAVMMDKADMDLLAMKGVNERVMDAFSDQDEIRGGFVMYGADSGKGGNIYWANGKPFVHDRYIMWKGAGDQRDPVMIAKRIAQLRGLSTDKSKSTCYSFIQVHCWSYKYGDVMKSFLDNINTEGAENVKVVTPGELIDLIVKNVEPNEQGYTS